MGFFDSLKANANVLKDKATDLAQTGAAESKRLAEIAKLTTLINWISWLLTAITSL